MTHSRAFQIVLLAARQYANGNEHCAEIHAAVRVVEEHCDDGGYGHLEWIIMSIRIWIESHLQHLKHRDTVGVNSQIVNSYAVAEIPAWEMRQKLDLLIFGAGPAGRALPSDCSICGQPHLGTPCNPCMDDNPANCERNERQVMNT